MKDKITAMCKQYGMHSPRFVRGEILYGEMLEGELHSDGTILKRIEASIKIWADPIESNWNILDIVSRME